MLRVTLKIGMNHSMKVRMSSRVKTSPISLLGLTIWGLAAFFFLYEFFLRTFVGSVAHQVMYDLHLNAETFAVVGSAYYVAYGLMQVPVGILADKFGVKPIMIFAVLTCVLSTILFAQAEDFTGAFTSRLLMGFGSSFAFVCLLVIADTWLPKQYFGFFAGVSQFIGTMGPLLAAGPLIALMAKTGQDWRQTLTAIAWVGVVLACLMLVIVRGKPRDPEQRLIYLRSEVPLMKRLSSLMRNQQAWVVAIYSASTYVSMALIGAIWGTKYLQLRGLTQGAAANTISLAWLGYAVGCPLLGAFSDIAKRRKPTLVFAAGLGLIATLSIIFLPLTAPTWVYWTVFFSLGLAASGQNVGFATITEHTDVNTRATALGLNNGMITLFGAFVPPLVSYFIYLSVGSGTVDLTAEDFTVPFILMPVLYIIALTTAYFFIHETYCKPQKEIIKLRMH